MLLKVLSHAFGGAVEVRNHLYDREMIAADSLSVPVFSIGNISVGGTGKTSFAIWLLRELTSRGLKVGVISRGYGGQVRSPTPVPWDGDAAVYGDEPCLIASERLGPVYVGPKRSEVGKALLADHPVDVIIADDAFQHRKLNRDVDIVLLDYSESRKNLFLLPQGRLREDFSALNRAHVVVTTKRSLADEENTSFFEERIPEGKIRLEMDYEMEPQEIYPDSVLLVSGVARPDGVLKLAKTKYQVKDHLIFRDHHNYNLRDVEKILNMMKSMGCDRFLTTEKDAVKLQSFGRLSSRMEVMKLRYIVRGEVDEFFETLIRKVK